MRGTTCSSNILFISRGTPGMKNARASPSVVAKPGAVPMGFASTSAPCGKSACFAFDSLIVRPSFSKRRRMWSSDASSRSSATPSVWATTSVVRSSVVGPSPPVHTMTRAPAARRFNVDSMRARSSSTMTFSTTSKPRSVR